VKLEHPSEPRPSRRSVLIVDDDDDAREMMGELLDAMGHNTVKASSAHEALELVERERLDLALIDLGLPDVDGCEIARRIRRTIAGAGLRLVALTGYSDDATRQSAVDAGFDDFLVKPAYPATIEAAVNAAPVGSASSG
jgi:CheY-like chemotaxis protein